MAKVIGMALGLLKNAAGGVWGYVAMGAIIAALSGSLYVEHLRLTISQQKLTQEEFNLRGVEAALKQQNASVQLYASKAARLQDSADAAAKVTQKAINQFKGPAPLPVTAKLPALMGRYVQEANAIPWAGGRP